MRGHFCFTFNYWVAVVGVRSFVSFIGKIFPAVKNVIVFQNSGCYNGNCILDCLCCIRNFRKTAVCIIENFVRNCSPLGIKLGVSVNSDGLVRTVYFCDFTGGCPRCIAVNGKFPAVKPVACFTGLGSYLSFS